jgi:hypothetical protein
MAIKIVKGDNLKVGKIYKPSFPSKENLDGWSFFLVLENNEKRTKEFCWTSYPYKVLSKKGIEIYYIWETTWFDEMI